MSSRFSAALAPGVLAFALAWPGPALADDPSFEYSEPPEEGLDGVEWKASAQAGLILTTGNSRTTTLSGGAKGSRKAGRDKLELEASGAFARSTLFLASDDNENGVIDDGEFERISQTTTRSWLLRGRYDRFLAEKDSLYVVGLASGDKPTGKSFVGGGQLGYSRILVKGDTHSVVVEAGYDFSYEDFVSSSDTLSIHSGRAQVGYEGVLSEHTGLSATTELLLNLNRLETPTGAADRLEDARLNSKVALTTRVSEEVNFRFGFTAKYDNVPAPRPPFALPYADGFAPPADRLDTITEASLIVSFL